jgi:hypothetical protein
MAKTRHALQEKASGNDASWNIIATFHLLTHRALPFSAELSVNAFADQQGKAPRSFTQHNSPIF